MHILSLTALTSLASDAPSIVTIGNFDGVHRGHQQLISAVKEQASQSSAISTVVLFEPQPLEFFCPTCAPARLMPLSNKLNRLKQLGIERVAVMSFHPQFAQLTAQEFVQNLLVKRLHAQSVWVGDDFRFGAGRCGDFSLMQTLGMQYGFSVSQTPSLLHEGRRISSTWVRESLTQGDMTTATALLGAHYRLYGHVAHGQKLGRQLGFPTMNLNFRHPLAISGVFVVMIIGLTEQPLHGVANLGTRPSVSGGDQQRLEVHVFDWEGSAYGKKIEVVFCHRLRSEQKFESLEHLKHQINADVAQARSWWQNS